jgi:GNAT superfamily N-acetyltransferase
MNLIPFNTADPTHLEAAAQVWNAACGPELPISAQFVAYNVRPCAGGAQAGRLAFDGGAVVGFALASLVDGEPLVTSENTGWIDALAVAPTAQHNGCGGELLNWAERWLAERGRTQINLGGSLRPFAPGLPEELGRLDFYTRRGYVERYMAYDMAANLATYTPPPAVRDVDAAARPAQPGQEEALLGFLRREFAGRWRYEAEDHLRQGMRISDFMLLWTTRGVDGCCLLTFQDSGHPLERFYPYRLPKPWGQLGSIGISEDCRGKGYGAVLLDAGLRRLHNNGVNGCVIDWTGLVDFYGKFGFEVYRAYHCLRKG